LITERHAVSAKNPVTKSDGSPKKFPAASSVSTEESSKVRLAHEFYPYLGGIIVMPVGL
jgi:hypothetical protein